MVHLAKVYGTRYSTGLHGVPHGFIHIAHEYPMNYWASFFIIILLTIFSVSVHDTDQEYRVETGPIFSKLVLALCFRRPLNKVSVNVEYPK
jgi:hypothetical protein